jgi:hypothetical protein
VRDLKGGPKSGRLQTLLRVVLALFPEMSVTDGVGSTLRARTLPRRRSQVPKVVAAQSSGARILLHRVLGLTLRHELPALLQLPGGPSLSALVAPFIREKLRWRLSPTPAVGH